MGWSRRTAVSAYVSSEKNAVSIVCRFVGRERGQRFLQQAAPLPCLDDVRRPGCLDLLVVTVRRWIGIDALLAPLEPQAVESPSTALAS